MEQHRLTQEAVFGAVARLVEISAALLGLGPVTTAEVHAELAKQYPDPSFRTPTREAVYLQLHRLKKKRLLLSKRQGKEVSWELAAKGRKLLEKKTQREKEAEMRDDVEILAEEERLKGIFGGGTQGESAEGGAEEKGWGKIEQRFPRYGPEENSEASWDDGWGSADEADLDDTVEMPAFELEAVDTSSAAIGAPGPEEAADQEWARAMSEVSPEPNNDEEDDGA